MRIDILFFVLFFFACQSKNEIVIDGKTMGTTFQIKFVDSSQTENLSKAIDSCLIEINRQMSTWIPSSEISQFNQHQDTNWFEISSDFKTVLLKSAEVFRESHGAFDPTVKPLVELWGFGAKGRRTTRPKAESIDSVMKFVGFHNLEISDRGIRKRIPQLSIDLSAIAKGYAVDRVAQILYASGIQNFMVEIGGEILCNGFNSNGDIWAIGIDKPNYNYNLEHELQEIVVLPNKAMAGSGDYRNYFRESGQIYSHEIDPKSGRPFENKMTAVNVIANDCMTADAWATAFMILGPEISVAIANAKSDIEVYAIYRSADSLAIMSSKDFKQYLKQ